MRTNKLTVHGAPVRGRRAATEIRLLLSIPRVQFGFFNLGSVSGLDAALKPFQHAEKRSTDTSSQYPLTLPDGTNVMVPMELPLIGAVTLGLGFAKGVLWVGVPNVPLLLKHVESALHLAEGVTPRLHDGSIFYPVSAHPGDRVALPIPSFGEISAEITA